MCGYCKYYQKQKDKLAECAIITRERNSQAPIFTHEPCVFYEYDKREDWRNKIYES